MESKYLFEICAVNIQSALAAEAAGAHRIELCSALDMGGITPSAGLIRAAVAALNIPVNVLIRPREGAFCYSNLELQIILDDIRFCLDAGVNGVVVGALDADHQLDLPKLAAMRDAAGVMEIVHHRAFDFCKQPVVALEQLIDLGYDRILSSGQSDDAYQGRFLLQQLVQQANGRIEIMPGAGINASNIRDIATTSGAKAFHFTGKSKMDSTNGNVIQGLDAWYWQSDEGQIRKVIAALNEL